MIRSILREVDQRLHDARLDLRSLRRDRDEVQLAGTVERPAPGRPIPLLARFTVLVRIRDVEAVSVEDDEGIGELIIESVTFDAEARELLFESAIPGRLRVRTNSPSVDVQIGEEPTETRRWGRWRQTSTDLPF